jgi:hypothetical protein
MARAIANPGKVEHHDDCARKSKMLFAHLKRILKLDRPPLRGANGARDEFVLSNRPDFGPRSRTDFFIRIGQQRTSTDSCPRSAVGTSHSGLTQFSFKHFVGESNQSCCFFDGPGKPRRPLISAIGCVPPLAVAKMSDRKSKAPLIVHAADALRRARKLPVGAARNDLRLLAQGLLKLHRSGLRCNVEIVEKPTKH